MGGTQAAYRLLAHEEVDWDAVLTPHWECSVERMRGQAVVLCVQDCTELDFGWQTEDYPGGEGYVMVKVGGEAVGGMMAEPPECAGMPPAWGLYVTVDDVDATAQQVEALGGKLLRAPEDIPDIGRFCVLQDPQGATLCAITYRKP